MEGQFYALEDDGFVHYEIHKRYIGPQVTLLESMAKMVPKTLNGLMEGVSVSVSQDGVSISKRLPTLELNTYFRPIKRGEDLVALVPVFAAPGAEMKFTWVPPDNMGLYFIGRWDTRATSQSLAFIEPMFYLVAKDLRVGKTYLLPLPNLYDDAKICLGSGVRFKGVPALSQLQNAITQLQTTSWNVDLLRDVAQQTEGLFRYDANGKQMPPVQAWTQLCKLVNHHAYEFIAKI